MNRSGQKKTAHHLVIEVGGHSFQRFLARYRSRAGTSSLSHIHSSLASVFKVRQNRFSDVGKHFFCDSNIIVPSPISAPFAKSVKSGMANCGKHVTLCPHVKFLKTLRYGLIKAQKVVIGELFVGRRGAQWDNGGKSISFTKARTHNEHGAQFHHLWNNEPRKVAFQNGAGIGIKENSHSRNLHKKSAHAIAGAKAPARGEAV